MAEMLRDISRPGAEGERVAEIGEFDFRWGNSQTAGYYYHWTRFAGITETSDGLFLVLAEDRKIIIPRSAFQNEGEAQQFLAEARARWQAAKHKQRYLEQETDGVWPPAPRLEVL